MCPKSFVNQVQPLVFPETPPIYRVTVIDGVTSRSLSLPARSFM
jgi:hypothetical protein